jgi:sulfite reductase (ferredoxin)
LGIDDFRVLTEKYFGQKFEPWHDMIDFKFLDWLGWHDQGDGKWMLGVNVEQGRIRDTEEVKVKSALRKIVDLYGSTETKEGVDLILTPAQSVVLRNIKPENMLDIEKIVHEHGIKSLAETDRLSRKSMACPAFPLCGLAVTEAERVQPEINSRLVALLDKMDLHELVIVTRTTGCPNGCARPYMAEMALVGSGKGAYQVWFGGHPEQVGRTGFPMASLFKMKLSDLEVTMEPVFAMYKQQRLVEDEAFGDFTNRVGEEAIDAYMATYVPGSYDKMDPDEDEL